MLWDEKICAAQGVIPLRETWKTLHWEGVVLNQTKQPGDKPWQEGRFGSKVRISSLDNMLKANIFP